VRTGFAEITAADVGILRDSSMSDDNNSNNSSSQTTGDYGSGSEAGLHHSSKERSHRSGNNEDDDDTSASYSRGGATGASIGADEMGDMGGVTFMTFKALAACCSSFPCCLVFSDEVKQNSMSFIN